MITCINIAFFPRRDGPFKLQKKRKRSKVMEKKSCCSALSLISVLISVHRSRPTGFFFLYRVFRRLNWKECGFSILYKKDHIWNSNDWTYLHWLFFFQASGHLSQQDFCTRISYVCLTLRHPRVVVITRSNWAGT